MFDRWEVIFFLVEQGQTGKTSFAQEIVTLTAVLILSANIFLSEYYNMKGLQTVHKQRFRKT